MMRVLPNSLPLCDQNPLMHTHTKKKICSTSPIAGLFSKGGERSRRFAWALHLPHGYGEKDTTPNPNKIGIRARPKISPLAQQKPAGWFNQRRRRAQASSQGKIMRDGSQRGLVGGAKSERFGVGWRPRPDVPIGEQGQGRGRRRWCVSVRRPPAGGGMWNGMGMLRHCRQLLASRRSRSGVVENKLQKLPHRPLPSRHVAACGGSWA
jgi:hypothetical protein